MRIGIIGANGQLGSDLVKAFSGHEVIAWTRADFDVRDRDAVEKHIASARPDAVVNTAAFHKTDACEDDPSQTFAVNAIGARTVAQACQRHGAAIVFISTDFVFGGEKYTPYTERDCPTPLNVYGVSKLAGERLVASYCERHYTVRVASLFGLSGSSGKGGNFVETVLTRARRGDSIPVVDDITMSPTYCTDAAQVIGHLLEMDAAPGIYHAANSGSCTWFDFAQEVIQRAGYVANLQRVSIRSMASKARRPGNSALTSVRLGTAGIPVPRSWQDALSAYLEARGVTASRSMF